ncbi:MerR family transcriptional regulator [Arthrobacter sp. zg-Y769]|uniref:MerR family transcriptional regulator n=1 Tax=Arthrobacter sp. zg-Y769 TaxID=2894191 RepID=UPI001E42249D|nr:MerR family transcriptional regulator [Arthrobacter sp. zg-Y769]MCC9204567.1 MerR family transcriptional regulator [Arthrobacter sp. zg-Y769]
MQISELVQRADVPLATVKFYIREGLLPAGRATSATRADYDENHLARLRLIRSLTVVAGLPLNRVKKILDVIDHPKDSIYETLGTAIDALTGFLPGDQDPDRGCPRAEAALASLGSAYNASDDRMAAFVQLESALRAVEEVGMPADAARLRLYGDHVMAIARAEIDGMSTEDPQAAVQYAVLGTALYEPVLTAIRRLAHQNLAIGVQ